MAFFFFDNLHTAGWPDFLVVVIGKQGVPVHHVLHGLVVLVGVLLLGDLVPRQEVVLVEGRGVIAAHHKQLIVLIVLPVLI